MPIHPHLSSSSNYRWGILGQIVKNEEHFSESPGHNYEDFMDDVFDQQYGDEGDQKH